MAFVHWSQLIMSMINCCVLDQPTCSYVFMLKSEKRETSINKTGALSLECRKMVKSFNVSEKDLKTLVGVWLCMKLLRKVPRLPFLHSAPVTASPRYGWWGLKFCPSCSSGKLAVCTPAAPACEGCQLLASVSVQFRKCKAAIQGFCF